MATPITIIGESGTGKTYALRNIDPKELFIINCDQKGLPFRGWRKKFSVEHKNFYRTSDFNQIISLIKNISSKQPHIKVIAVDTISSMMSDKEMEDQSKKGFDKWNDYAKEVYDLISFCNDPSLRDDLFIVLTAHPDYYDKNGETHTRLKTGGKKLTKLNVEGKLLYTFYTKVEHSPEGNKYMLTTQTDGYNTARSPADVLPLTVDNDLDVIIKLINDFENEY